MSAVRRAAAGAVLPLIAMAPIMMAGCGSSSEDEARKSATASEAKKVTVAIALPLDVQFFSGIKRGAQEQAKKMPGVSLKVTATPGQFSPQKYLDTIESTAQGADAIAVDSLGPDVMRAPMRRLTASGKNVVIYLTPPLNQGEKSVVLTDTEGAIRAGMNEMVAMMDGKGPVGLIANPGDPIVSVRLDLARKALQAAGVTQIHEVRGDCLSIVKGANATQDLIQRHPDIKGIFVGCGLPGIGAGRAVAQRNLDISVFSFDGEPAEVKAVKAGQLAGAIRADAEEMGAETVKTLVAVARGEKVQKLVHTGFAVVTQKNAAEFG